MRVKELELFTLGAWVLVGTCTAFFSLVLSREWGNGLWGLLLGLYRGYYRDPFPHSLLSTRESFV